MNAQQLIQALLERGFKKADISRETKLHKSTLTYWEQGKVTPDPDKLEKLRKFYRKVKREKGG